MRSVQESPHLDGTTTYRVRFRLAGKQTSETFFKRKDAETFAVLLDAGGTAEALGWLEQKRDPLNYAGTGYTFAEWFEHYVDHLTGVTERTRADYRAQHRRYLTSLDPLPLGQVTRAHVAGIINRLDRDGRSPKTIKNAINMLASCFASAVEEGHIDRNPARKHRLPRTGEEHADDLAFLTHEEFARLLAQIPEHYRPLVAFLVATGLRWSEATALQWRHINWTAHTVKVRQAWKRVPGKGFELGPPKSKKSRRTVNVPPQVIDGLRERRGKPDEFVFTTVQGKPVSHANFYVRVYQPAAKRAGLKVNVHALRHTHASWLISMGIPLEQIQDQLGHESILTTRDTYAHLLPSLGAQVGQAAAAAMLQVEQARPAIAT